MKSDTEFSMEQGWKNLKRMAQLAEKHDRLDEEQWASLTEDEKIDFVAARILKQHRRIFEELAK